MTKPENHGTKILATIALAALVAAPVLGQEEKAPELAIMATSPGGVSWTPRGDFDTLVLTVKGGGFTVTREFGGGQPYFAAVDPGGYLLPDGTYVWELTATEWAPRAADRAANDRPTANGRASEAAATSGGLVQSGAFTIVDGAIVDPGGPAGRAAAGIDGPRAAAEDADGASQ